MPEWAQLIMGAAAIITALGVLWTKVLKPGARLISTTEEMLPLLRNLTSTFRDTPQSFAVLKDISSQFTTDSGSTLRDVLNNVEALALETQQMLVTAATDLRHADETLKIGVETTKQLAAIDRETMRQLMLEVNRLNAQLADLTAADLASKAQVAADLKKRQREVDTDRLQRRGELDAGTAGIAENLASDKSRADAAEAAPDSAPGAAADAAALTPTAAERRAHRRAVEEERRAQWDLDQENDQDDESPT